MILFWSVPTRLPLPVSVPDVRLDPPEEFVLPQRSQFVHLHAAQADQAVGVGGGGRGVGQGGEGGHGFGLGAKEC